MFKPRNLFFNLAIVPVIALTLNFCPKEPESSSSPSSSPSPEEDVNPVGTVRDGERESELLRGDNQRICEQDTCNDTQRQVGPNLDFTPAPIQATPTPSSSGSPAPP